MDYTNQNESRYYGQCDWHEIPKYRVGNPRYRSANRRNRDIFKNKPRRHKGIKRLFLSVGLILVLGVIAYAGVPQFVEALNKVAGSTIESTPKSEWIKGSMPYLYQTDKRWANAPYAGGTVADSACGPTCMTMAYIYLTGNKDFDPASMSAFSERNGYVQEGMTAWSFFSEGSAMLGLEPRELGLDRTAIMTALRSGQPVIASVSKGDFTTTGHLIVLCGIDENNQIEIRDPNSPRRSKQHWDLDRIVSQARNFWAFTCA